MQIQVPCAPLSSVERRNAEDAWHQLLSQDTFACSLERLFALLDRLHVPTVGPQRDLLEQTFVVCGRRMSFLDFVRFLEQCKCMHIRWKAAVRKTKDDNEDEEEMLDAFAASGGHDDYTGEADMSKLADVAAQFDLALELPGMLPPTEASPSRAIEVVPTTSISNFGTGVMNDEALLDSPREQLSLSLSGTNMRYTNEPQRNGIDEETMRIQQARNRLMARIPQKLQAVGYNEFRSLLLPTPDETPRRNSSNLRPRVLGAGGLRAAAAAMVDRQAEQTKKLPSFRTVALGLGMEDAPTSLIPYRRHPINLDDTVDVLRQPSMRADLLKSIASRSGFSSFKLKREKSPPVPSPEPPAAVTMVSPEKPPRPTTAQSEVSEATVAQLRQRPRSRQEMARPASALQKLPPRPATPSSIPGWGRRTRPRSGIRYTLGTSL